MGHRHAVSIRNTAETFACDDAETLLRGMELLGRRGIPVGCRGGGCGVCKVRIDSGEVRTEKMSRQHVSVEEQADGVVLACRAYPCSDVQLSAIDKMARCIERSHARAAAPRSFFDGLRPPAPAAAPSPSPDSPT